MRQAMQSMVLVSSTHFCRYISVFPCSCLKEYWDISQIWESDVIIARHFYTPPRQYTEVLGRKLLHHLSLTCLRIIYLAAFCWHDVVGMDFYGSSHVFDVCFWCINAKLIQITRFKFDRFPKLYTSGKNQWSLGKILALALWCTQQSLPRKLRNIANSANSTSPCVSRVFVFPFCLA